MNAVTMLTGEIPLQHYAFIVSESELDEILGRIRDRGLPCWADPGHHRPVPRSVHGLAPPGCRISLETRALPAP